MPLIHSLHQLVSQWPPRASERGHILPSRELSFFLTLAFLIFNALLNQTPALHEIRFISKQKPQSLQLSELFNL